MNGNRKEEDHLRCDCVNGSELNAAKGLVLDKPPGYKSVFELEKILCVKEKAIGFLKN